MSENAAPHERAWNAASFGGRSTFLRLVSQPQDETIAAGRQCTSPIWVIDSISSSSLPGHVLICDNWGATQRDRSNA
jgi:hypothetical protein